MTFFSFILRIFCFLALQITSAVMNFGIFAPNRKSISEVCFNGMKLNWFPIKKRLQPILFVNILK